MRGFRPFWLEQALASEKAAPAPPLAGPVRADVCIVGGGYTGLWTALQIKRQAPAKEVVLLESDICGAGASGRNGGCVLSWATKFKTLCRLFGLDEAARLVRASEQAIDEIGAFVREHRIDCDFRHEGVLYTAIANAHVGSTDAVIADLAAHGLNSYMTLPVDEARREFERIVTKSPLWDKRIARLEVTDSGDTTMELRALVSAANSADLWTLRCHVREKLIAFIHAPLKLESEEEGVVLPVE